MSRHPSWLRLEQLRLGELSRDDQIELKSHVDSCDACQHAVRVVERPVALLPLPEERKVSWWNPMLVAASLAVVAGLLLWLSTGPRIVQTDESLQGIKGRIMSLSVVRNRRGNVSIGPETFTTADRFKIVVSCAMPGRTKMEVTVRQQGQTFSPLPGHIAPCASSVVIPGAFALSGGQGSICVKITGEGGGETRQLCHAIRPE